MYVLLRICVFSAVVVLSNAIQCYSFDSRIDKNMTETECSNSTYCAQYVGSGFGKTVNDVKGCDVLEYTENNKTDIVKCSEKYVEKCRSIESKFGFKIKLCCCKTDLCNGATVQGTQLTVMSILIAAILYVLN